jgi:hypothetical protein
MQTLNLSNVLESYASGSLQPANTTDSGNSTAPSNATTGNSINLESPFWMQLTSMSFAENPNFPTLEEAKAARPTCTTCPLSWCANTYGVSHADSGILYDTPTAHAVLDFDLEGCIQVRTIDDSAALSPQVFGALA